MGCHKGRKSKKKETRGEAQAMKNQDDCLGPVSRTSPKLGATTAFLYFLLWRFAPKGGKRKNRGFSFDHEFPRICTKLVQEI
jgi:hypothetical protein